MLEFNTDEDLHTVIQYKRQIYKGSIGVVMVDIEKLAERYEEECKELTMLMMINIGLPLWVGNK